MIAALVATAALVVTVTFRFFDYDLWEHLVVGKYIWATREIPTSQLWTWPTYGQPALIPSWAFRALLWPFWDWGGIPGLFVWRWLTTLLTFGVLFLAARRLRSDPILTLVILVLCALPYRGRTMVRPETLAYVLFAVQLWLLTARRRGGSSRDVWLVAIAWIWINVHISFYIGFVNLAIHAIAEFWSSLRARPRREAASRDGSPGAWPLARVALASLAISFVNPFGWHAVVQPLTHLLQGRSEIIYQTIGELRGIDWNLNWKSGLPLLMLGWPALILWRARRRDLDVVEGLTCIFFTCQALFSQRFRGFYSLAAAPYLARDLTELLAGLRKTPLALPPGVRGVLASIGIVAVGWMEWTLPQLPIGIGLDMRYFPVKACDFIEATGIRGRAFNHFHYGGYMEYRFWPDRTRLPFMDGHLESGTERDRTLYTYAQVNREAWEELDREKGFDFILLALKVPSGLTLHGFIESDTAWAAVFIDDAAVVFVRRSGPLASVAERYAYRLIGVAPRRLNDLMTRCTKDPSLRVAVRREFEGQVEESPYNAVAHSMLAEIALMDGRRVDARGHLERALAADPDFATAHERIGLLDLKEGKPEEALRRFRLEYRLRGSRSGFDLRLGMVRQARGDLGGAREAYRRALRRNPMNREARGLLDSLERTAPER